MSFTREDLLKLLRFVDLTTADEIDCMELLQRAAGYLERLGPDGPDGLAPAGYEDVVRHLQLCPECLEEVEALRCALRAEERPDE